MATRKLLACAIAALMLSACSNNAPTITDCAAKDGMQPICQLKNPEDTVLLPDGKNLLVSQMGLSMAHADPGSPGFFDIQTEQPTPALFTGQTASSTLRDMREALLHNFPLGNDRFRESIEWNLGRSVGYSAQGRPLIKNKSLRPQLTDSINRMITQESLGKCHSTSTL